MIEDEHTTFHIEYTDEDKEHWAYSPPESNKEYEARMLSNERKSFWKMFVWVNVILACVCFSGDVFGKDCSEWDKLTDNQRKVAEWLYKRGESHDLQLTLPAIAWTESTLGKFRLNIRSGDLGLMQLNYKTSQRTLGVTNYFKQAELHQRLIYDDELNTTIALSVLEHFKKVHKGNWKKMVMSYNIGNNKSEKYLQRGVDYYGKVVYHLNILKQCSNFN